MPATREAGGVLAELQTIAERLAHLCAATEQLTGHSDDVGHAALHLRVSRLYDQAFAILDDCGVDPLAGERAGGVS